MAIIIVKLFDGAREIVKSFEGGYFIEENRQIAIYTNSYNAAPKLVAMVSNYLWVAYNDSIVSQSPSKPTSASARAPQSGSDDDIPF